MELFGFDVVGWILNLLDNFLDWIYNLVAGLLGAD